MTKCRGRSSAGRASRSQCEGREFDPPRLHKGIKNLMSSHYLEKMFEPSSIAVIGASNRTTSVGMRVYKNLLFGKYNGQLYAVNPKHKTVQGQPCFSSINDLDEMIDLAIITT